MTLSAKRTASKPPRLRLLPAARHRHSGQSAPRNHPGPAGVWSPDFGEVFGNVFGAVFGAVVVVLGELGLVGVIGVPVGWAARSPRSRRSRHAAAPSAELVDECLALSTSMRPGLAADAAKTLPSAALPRRGTTRLTALLGYALC